MTQRFPRVLIVTPCAFNHEVGGGITFSNLFRGWPPECLATATDDWVPVAYDVCRNYYFLGQDEHDYIWPFDRLRVLYRKLSRRKISSSPGNCGDQKLNTAIHNPSRLRRMLQPLLGETGIPERGIVSSRLSNWIEEFQPDLIYTVLGSLAHLDFVSAIQSGYGLPLAVHLMDHGVTDPRRKGLLGPYLRRAYGKKFKALLARAGLRMAIGEDMAREYEKIYGYSFCHFQNTIDIEKWEKFFARDHTPGNPPVVMYVGSIMDISNLDSLMDFCQVVERLRKEGSSVRFEIYTSLSVYGHYAQRFAAYPGVSFQGLPEGDEGFFRTIGKADILLLPVNFDRRSFHFMCLSMPTKLPAYLASGTPILVYGPARVAMVEYARRERWGLVVDRRDLRALADALTKLLANGVRSELSQAARAAAARNHDAVVVRTGFQRALIDLGTKRDCTNQLHTEAPGR